MMATVGFAIVAAGIVFSAIRAVSSPHLVQSVLWLACTLIAIAVIYLFLDATFLAAIQVILYAGGVITLMLFGVMLTDRKHDVTRDNPSHGQGLGLGISAAVFGLLSATLWRSALPAIGSTTAPSAEAIGASFLGPHLLAFEALSVLLLAAVLGAIVLARRSDP